MTTAQPNPILTAIAAYQSTHEGAPMPLREMYRTIEQFAVRHLHELTDAGLVLRSRPTPLRVGYDAALTEAGAALVSP